MTVEMEPGRPGAGGLRVVVCVATYRRPAELAALLDSLGALAVPDGVHLAVCVVDNDELESAREVVDTARARVAVPLEYSVEPERNISLARNRGVARALELGADFVAFIDDDEVARPGWLAALLEVQARFAADAVEGTVVPRIPGGAPGWAGPSRLFEQRQPPAGTPLRTASTNTSLVSRRLLESAQPGPFDPRFGRSGSSDSLFFTRWVRHGARVVAAPGAVVEETLPPARARAAWVLRRAFRVGNGAVWVERALDRPSRRLAWRAFAGTVRLVGSAAILPGAALLGRARAVRALWGVAYGVGCVAALAGYRYSEYEVLDR